METTRVKIFIRANAIFAANFNDILDRAENPANMLRQMIAEIEDAILAAKTDVSRSHTEQKRLDKESQSARQAQLEWKDKAKFAASKDRLDLARSALEEAEKSLELAAKFQLTSKQLIVDIAEFESQITKLETKLSEARSRRNVTLLQTAQDSNQESRGQVKTNTSKIDATLNRIDVLEKRFEFAEARNQAFEQPSEVKNLELELAEIARAAKVEAGLIGLKSMKRKK
jgi:phage shock protein A